MTRITRTERYETNACMDRQDAQEMSDHLLALASTLVDRKGIVAMDQCDHETGLHFARLVRILQRATQPDVVGQAGCAGVSKIVLHVVDGVRTFTVSTPRADIIINADRRTLSLDGTTGQVVSIERFDHRRRA